jgi:Tfp pilus assembly protein PilE
MAREKSGKRKKKLLIFVVIIAVLGLVFYGGYRFYLPTMIANTLTSDQPSPLVPAAMQEEVSKLKSKVKREIKKLPAFLKQNNIEYKDLLNIVDRARPRDLMAAYREIASTRITSTNQVFNIGKKHIKIKGYDLEIFRRPFNQKLTVEDIQRGLLKIQQNKTLTAMSIPVAKETVKEILESSRSEVQRELNKLNQTNEKKKKAVTETS